MSADSKDKKKPDSDDSESDGEDVQRFLFRMAGGGREQRLKSAAGTFVGIRLEIGCAKQLPVWLRSLNVPNPYSVRDLHATIIKSKTEIPIVEPGPFMKDIAANSANKKYMVLTNDPITVKADDVKLVNFPNTSFLVLKFESKELAARNAAAVQAGGIHEGPFPWTSHITVSNDWPKGKPAPTEPLPFDLVLKGEYNEPNYPDWAPNQPSQNLAWFAGGNAKRQSVPLKLATTEDVENWALHFLKSSEAAEFLKKNRITGNHFAQWCKASVSELIKELRRIPGGLTIPFGALSELAAAIESFDDRDLRRELEDARRAQRAARRARGGDSKRRGSDSDSDSKPAVKNTRVSPWVSRHVSDFQYLRKLKESLIECWNFARERYRATFPERPALPEVKWELLSVYPDKNLPPHWTARDRAEIPEWLYVMTHAEGVVPDLKKLMKGWTWHWMKCEWIDSVQIHYAAEWKDADIYTFESAFMTEVAMWHARDNQYAGGKDPNNEWIRSLVRRAYSRWVYSHVQTFGTTKTVPVSADYPFKQITRVASLPYEKAQPAGDILFECGKPVELAVEFATPIPVITTSNEHKTAVAIRKVLAMTSDTLSLLVRDQKVVGLVKADVVTKPNAEVVVARFKKQHVWELLIKSKGSLAARARGKISPPLTPKPGQSAVDAKILGTVAAAMGLSGGSGDTPGASAVAAGSASGASGASAGAAAGHGGPPPLGAGGADEPVLIPLCVVTYGEATPPPTNDEARYQDEIRKAFDKSSSGPVVPLNMPAIWPIVQEARRQQHGTMVVISTHAAVESKRLEKQSTPLKVDIKQGAAPLDPALVNAITSIDGAILLDPHGVCFSCGVIVDGQLIEGQGEPSRGARYNSALKYTSSTRHGPTEKKVALVISEDGMFNILPAVAAPSASGPAVTSKSVDLDVVGPSAANVTISSGSVINFYAGPATAPAAAAAGAASTG